MTADPMLTVQGLNAWYGAAHILYDLSFDVGSGEVVALMGRNGAGKSTTMKSIMGLVGAEERRIRFCGHDISRRALRDRPPGPGLRAGGPAHLL